MTKIAKNIQHLRKLRSITQEQLANDLEVTRSRIGSYEEGRSEPSIEMLISLSNYYNLPIDALIRHDLSLSKDKSFIDIGKQRILFPIVVNEDNEDDLIEVISAKASAGYLNGYSDPEFIEQLEKIKLPFMPTGKHRAFPIKGDSMLPIKEGSYVVARFIEDINDLKEGKTYIMLTQNEGIVYKRIYEQDAENFRFSSDNKIYTPYNVPKETILEAWEFTCSINTQEYEEEELKVDGIMRMFRELQVELEAFKNGYPVKFDMDKRKELD